jgi:recombination protein RecT
MSETQQQAGQQAGLQVAEKKPEKARTISGFLEKYRAQIEMALPKHVTPDRMIRMSLTAINSNRALKDCTPESLFASVIIASQMGLEIGIGGQGYLIPYKGKATFVPGWQGIVDLVQRAGRALVWTGAVYEGDKFDWQLGDAPYVRHQPCGEDDPKKLTHVYAIGQVKEMDAKIIEVWPADKVWTHRDRFNKVGEKHYSYAHPEAYARKVVLLQVVKYLPKSIELRQAMMAEDAAETGKGLTLDMETAVVIPEADEDAGGGEAPKTARERAAEAAGRTPGAAGKGAPGASGAPEREPGE